MDVGFGQAPGVLFPESGATTRRNEVGASHRTDAKGFCDMEGRTSPSCAPFAAGGGACPRSLDGTAATSFCVQDTYICPGVTSACFRGPPACFPVYDPGRTTCTDGGSAWMTCPCDSQPGCG
jgi:hypothetical protein